LSFVFLSRSSRPRPPFDLAAAVVSRSCCRSSGIPALEESRGGVLAYPVEFGLGAGAAMGSDSQANGDHHTLPAAKAEQAVEEGESGEVLSDIQANGNHHLPPPVETTEAVEEGDAGETMEGVASIALLPSGAISGHFIRLPDSVCYGLHGTRTHRSPFFSYSLLQLFLHELKFDNFTLLTQAANHLWSCLLKILLIIHKVLLGHNS
jgi:hypothetical protein